VLLNARQPVVPETLYTAVKLARVEWPTRMRRAVLSFMLVAAFGCEAQRAVPTPPAGSDSTKTAQVKIRGTVVTANVAEVAPEFFRAVMVAKMH
jgi:hypothetical protein